jgi:hypothetical protein
LVEDLLQLEKGVDGLKAGVVLYIGDNLEMHEIGGFNRSFSSGHICRFCRIHYQEVHKCDGYIRSDLWTPEIYDSICDALEEESEVESFSLRERCPLNKLECFHAADSMAPDLMHDFMEGVVANDLLGILKCLEKDHWFTADQYNEQLR